MHRLCRVERCAAEIRQLNPVAPEAPGLDCGAAAASHPPTLLHVELGGDGEHGVAGANNVGLANGCGRGRVWQRGKSVVSQEGRRV